MWHIQIFDQLSYCYRKFIKDSPLAPVPHRSMWREKGCGGRGGGKRINYSYSIDGWVFLQGISTIPSSDFYYQHGKTAEKFIRFCFCKVSSTHQLKGLADGNYWVEIYIHVLDLTRNSLEKCNYRSITGIEPAIPRCSALTNWATDGSCWALTTSSWKYGVLPCLCYG